MQNIVKDRKNSLLLNTNALNIIWGGASTKERYWRRRKDDSSDVIELVGVYWLEVSGKVPLIKLTPNTTYNLSFSLKFTETPSGWDNSLVIFKLQLPGQKAVSKAEKLATYLNDKEWLDAPEGGLEFSVTQDSSGMLTFTMYEIECEAWKKGLLIKDVKIIPQN